MPIYRTTWILEVESDDKSEYQDTLTSIADSLPGNVTVVKEMPNKENPDE